MLPCPSPQPGPGLLRVGAARGRAVQVLGHARRLLILDHRGQRVRGRNPVTAEGGVPLPSYLPEPQSEPEQPENPRPKLQLPIPKPQPATRAAPEQESDPPPAVAVAVPPALTPRPTAQDADAERQRPAAVERQPRQLRRMGSQFKRFLA
jgi:hypothetical protein